MSEPARDQPARDTRPGHVRVVIRGLLTPLGSCVMLLTCWLPWINLQCRQVRAEPSLWQLAGYEKSMYAFPALAALLLLLGVFWLWRRSRTLSWGQLVSSLAACAAWAYALAQRQELIRMQAEALSEGGDVAELLKELVAEPGVGFRLYLVGALVSAVGSIWTLMARRGMRRTTS